MKDSIKNVIATRSAYQGWARYLLNTLPNPDKVLEKIGRRLQEYHELKYDAHVWSCMQSRIAGLLSLKWMIKLGDNDEDDENYLVKFIDNIFKKYYDMPAIMTEMEEAVWYGNKFSELIWRVVQGYLIPVDIIGKPIEWFGFDDNNLPRFFPQGSLKGILLPRKKFLITRHFPAYDNPYGIAVFSKIYWSVFFKRNVVSFAVDFSEQGGITIVVKVPLETTLAEVEETAEKFESLRQHGIIVVPEETNAESLDTSRSAMPNVYNMLIQQFDAAISKAILSQTLTTEQGVRGTQALGTVHADIRQDIVDFDKRMVETQFNKLIRLIIDFNFPGVTEYPEFILYNEFDVDKNLADRDAALAGTSQVRFTKKYFTRNYGFRDDEIDIVEPTPPEPTLPFAESQDVETDKNQESLEKGSDIGLSDFDKATQKLLEPIIKLVNEGHSYDEIQSQMLELFPGLETSALENILAKGITIAQFGGIATNA